jgi:hypothetical protein
MTSREQKISRQPESGELAVTAGSARRGARPDRTVENDEPETVRAFVSRRLNASSGCLFPVRPEIQQPRLAVPIWMAALLATPCRATSNTEHHEVLWACIAGRAVYTNCSTETEFIQPLDVKLQRGDTLAVYWTPGESAYTVDVYKPNELVA